jgi:hypothetical protein
MSVYHSVPSDFWGFSISEIRDILAKDKWCQARITKETFSYDMLRGFHITDVGEYKIVAPTSKKLGHAIYLIKKAKFEKENPDYKPQPFIFRKARKEDGW